MTKGQIEAKISEAVSKFEIEFMGRGPKEINTLILQDMIIIKLNGFLSKSEKNLSENQQGVKLIKDARTALFENARDYFEDMIKKIIDINILSTHSDVSTKTGQKIIILTSDCNIEQIIMKNNER
ncbi:DUF2294 domain-containing protein [Cellulosilyticum sp. I15G10I2]|uniref:DUF2294 domain-containing protein n=1 Tax=Cellulosilyticum sp. I15G10I2 TaxID=1892843 RepID=UPI00085BF822|nr:DUF2294 domain-containing protein [Cellulosilyticum sp. I15G10I2]